MSSLEEMPDIKERRILCPNIVQQLWPTIRHIKKLKQLPTIEKLQAHMYKKFHMTSNDCEKHVNNAVKDGLLIELNVTVDEQSGEEVITYTAPENEVPRDGHDWYCYECHRPGKVVECTHCWRVFHLYCIKDEFNQNDKQFVCNVCLSLQKETERMIEAKSVTVNEMNEMLSYTYNRLSEKGSDIINLPDTEEDGYILKQLVYKKMDLNQMSNKTDKNVYRKLIEFQIDCQDIVHCVSVLHGPQGVPASLAIQILQDCIYDLNEIKQCPDCYRMSNQKQDKSWFCKPCNPRHELVFAKQKGFPFWPAKVVKVENDIYDVRFFGSFHERAFIDADSVRPITSTLTQLRIIKRTPPLNKALCELKKYQKALEEAEDSLNDNSNSSKNVSKRPRKRADGTRPRKKMVRIKGESFEKSQNDASFENNFNGLTDESVDANTPLKKKSYQQTSTPKVVEKSPMRTRNRGKKHAIDSLDSNGIKPKPNRKYTRRKPLKGKPSPKAQKELSQFFKNASHVELLDDNYSDDTQTTNIENIEKTKLQTNKFTNGIQIDEENQNSNSSYENERTIALKKDMNGKNEGSLARSRPVRTSKPNSRYKSPEIEYKMPKRKFRQERVVIKKEPVEEIHINEQVIQQNIINHYEFVDEPPLPPSTLTTNLSKKTRIKGKNKSLKSVVSESPIIEHISQIESEPIDAPVLSSFVISTPKPRGRPKGVKNKVNRIDDTPEKVVPIQTSPKISIVRDFSSSSGCNCEPKHKKEIKKLTESLESKHKMELMKLKKDLESVKKVNYRLQNQNSSVTKEIEQLKAESHNYDKISITSLEEKHKKEISLMKKKQWCFNCEAEAIYFCCWNTSYCSTECQQQHWHTEHKRTCRRVKR